MLCVLSCQDCYLGFQCCRSSSVLRHLGEGIAEEVVDRSGLPEADSDKPLAPVHVVSAGQFVH
jgi:hypothetical protein